MAVRVNAVALLLHPDSWLCDDQRAARVGIGGRTEESKTLTDAKISIRCENLRAFLSTFFFKNSCFTHYAFLSIKWIKCEMCRKRRINSPQIYFNLRNKTISPNFLLHVILFLYTVSRWIHMNSLPSSVEQSSHPPALYVMGRIRTCSWIASRSRWMGRSSAWIRECIELVLKINKQQFNVK